MAGNNWNVTKKGIQTNRRNLLRSCGIAGGAYGLGQAGFAGTAAADTGVESVQWDIENVWDAIVDILSSELASALSSMSASERAQLVAEIETYAVRTEDANLLSAADEIKRELEGEEEITPDSSTVDLIISILLDAVGLGFDLPVDACVRIPFINEGVCLSSISSVASVSGCPGAAGPVAAVSMDIIEEEVDSGGNWEVESEWSVWFGVDTANPACWFAGVDDLGAGTCVPLHTCSGSQAITTTTSESTVANVTWDLSSASIDESPIDLPTILFWVLVSLVALAIAKWLIPVIVSRGVVYIAPRLASRIGSIGWKNA